jgi:hypothetical protein
LDLTKVRFARPKVANLSPARRVIDSLRGGCGILLLNFTAKAFIPMGLGRINVTLKESKCTYHLINGVDKNKGRIDNHGLGGVWLNDDNV